MRLVPLLLATAFSAVLYAQIDSGGGISNVEDSFNHSSIGAVIETIEGSFGMIEVLYPPLPQLPPEQDDNSNNLPDVWEVENFGSVGVNPSDDSDGDGTSNVMEFLSGTDPNSAASVFRPVSEHKNSSLTLSMPTRPGRNYRVWGTPNLKSPWTVLDTFEGDGSVTEWQYPMNQTPQGYFLRIEIVIPPK